MLTKLKNSERFQREYNLYRTEIEKITVPQIKEHALGLLSRLKEQCSLIDEGHNSRNNGYIDPSSLRDNIIESVNIRKELSQIIKDSKS